MSLAAQAVTVMLASLVLYIVAPVLLLARRWFIRAGFAMLFAALLPLLWQGFFSDDDAPGFALLFLLAAPIPLLLIGVGVLRLVTRTARRWRNQRTQRRAGL